MANLARILRDRVRMMKDDAIAIARVVESAFKGQDELDDAMLDKDVRQVFYDLEEMQVLKVRRQEYEENGQALRGYYWRVMQEQAPATVTKSDMPDAELQLYSQLQDDAWKRAAPKQ